MMICSPLKDDLSYNKDASQSHTATGTAHGAQNAVDRNTTTCMRTKPIGSTSPDKTVWWKVDLGGVYNIYSVNILFKNYDGYGIKYIHVYSKNIFFQRYSAKKQTDTAE